MEQLAQAAQRIILKKKGTRRNTRHRESTEQFLLIIAEISTLYISVVHQVAFYQLCTICLLGWLNDQTFVRNAKCWLKIFDQDQTWKSHLNAYERRLNGQRCSSKRMLDETIFSFSWGLIFMLTERRAERRVYFIKVTLSLQR